MTRDREYDDCDDRKATGPCSFCAGTVEEIFVRLVIEADEDGRVTSMMIRGRLLPAGLRRELEEYVR